MTAHEELRERLAEHVERFLDAGVAALARRGVKVRRSDVGDLLDQFTREQMPTVLAWGDERAPWANCTGAGDCPEAWHVHGCYADLGQCDDPTDHHAALTDPAAADTLRAEVHARWHRALDDPTQEPDGPIRDHITSHDAKVKAEGWDAGVRHAEACPGGLACDPRTANPYRADGIERRDSECCASGRCEVCSPGYDWGRDG